MADCPERKAKGKAVSRTKSSGVGLGSDSGSDGSSGAESPPHRMSVLHRLDMTTLHKLNVVTQREVKSKLKPGGIRPKIGRHELMYVDMRINGKPIRALVDTGATHNFVAGTEVSRLGLRLEKESGRIKAVNSCARPIQGVARGVHVKMGSFQGKLNFTAVPMDDFQAILGLEFFRQTNTVVAPKAGMICMMGDKPRSIATVSVRAREKLSSAVQYQKGLQQGHSAYLAAMTKSGNDMESNPALGRLESWGGLSADVEPEQSVPYRPCEIGDSFAGEMGARECSAARLPLRSAGQSEDKPDARSIRPDTAPCGESEWLQGKSVQDLASEKRVKDLGCQRGHLLDSNVPDWNQTCALSICASGGSSEEETQAAGQDGLKRVHAHARPCARASAKDHGDAVGLVEEACAPDRDDAVGHVELRAEAPVRALRESRVFAGSPVAWEQQSFVGLSQNGEQTSRPEGSVVFAFSTQKRAVRAQGQWVKSALVRKRICVAGRIGAKTNVWNIRNGLAKRRIVLPLGGLALSSRDRQILSGDRHSEQLGVRIWNPEGLALATPQLIVCFGYWLPRERRLVRSLSADELLMMRGHRIWDPGGVFSYSRRLQTSCLHLFTEGEARCHSTSLRLPANKAKHREWADPQVGQDDILILRDKLC